MFEREIQSLYARVQKARARGELDTRAYLVATHEMIKLLDELALPILGTNPTDLPEHIVKRFRGYGPGTLMPSSGIRFMVPERIGHTYDPRKVLLQFRTDSKEWGIPSGQVEENDQNEQIQTAKNSPFTRKKNRLWCKEKAQRSWFKRRKGTGRASQIQVELDCDAGALPL